MPIGPQWQDDATMCDAEILGFTGKVTYEVHPDYYRPVPNDPQMRLGAIEVVSRRGTFQESTDYAYGTPVPGFEFTDEALIEKFRRNAARVLPRDSIERAVQAAFGLDALDDIAEMIQHVTPER